MEGDIQEMDDMGGDENNGYVIEGKLIKFKFN
jgi:hypothetical protein